MLTASAIIKAMVGGAVLHKQYNGGKAAYWLDDSKGRCISVPYREGKQVSASPLVRPCEPGLFDGYPQSYKIKGDE
jgi:hypothetical protein